MGKHAQLEITVDGERVVSSVTPLPRSLLLKSGLAASVLLVTVPLATAIGLVISVSRDLARDADRTQEQEPSAARAERVAA